MLRVLCLALCSLLTSTRADPGALLRLGMDIMNREVQSAMEESHILEKMAAEAGKKQPGMKPIKGITNLKVKDVLQPVITLNFVPEVGIFQCVSTGMTITGKSFMGGNMEIIVVLNITATNRLLQDEETSLPMFKSEGCEVTLVSVKTNLPSNMLPKVVNKFLDSTLNKVLPGLMCPAIDAVLVYVNRKWANLNAGDWRRSKGMASMSTLATVQPVVEDPNGQAIELAGNGEALDFPKDYVEGSSQLLLSSTLLSAELTLLQKSLSVDVQDIKIGKLSPQTTKTLARFFRKVAKAYPKPKPLMTQIRINKPPKVTMETDKSLLHLHGTLEMFAVRKRGKAPVSLFLLDVHFNLKILYSVHENRLQMATSLDRLLSLSRESSSIGDFNEKKLTDFITDYLQEAYVPTVNGVQQMMVGVGSLLLLWGLATPCQGLLETVGTLARIDKDELGKGVQQMMVGVGSLLLLWGLATPCQGLLETVGTLARIDKDELGKAIQNSLVGGPILQNVLGTVTSVNQGLLGSGGLLGGGGLLSYGGVFGVVQELSGLKIEELMLPKVSLKLLPGFGVQLNLHTKVGLHGSGPLGGLLELEVEVNVSSRVGLGVSSRGTPTLVLKRCSTLLGHISLLSGPSPASHPRVPSSVSQHHIARHFKDRQLAQHQARADSYSSRDLRLLWLQLCPVVDSVLGVVNELLGAVLCLVPMGALGSVEFTLATLPLISNQYIELDINPIVKSVAGDIIDFPKPPMPVKVPPKQDHTSQVTVPLYLFNTVFGLLQTTGALDIDITPDLVPSNVPLTTTGLAALVPEALGKLPPDQHLLLSLRVKEAPTITLQSKKATISILANIHVLSYNPQGTSEALFDLSGAMTLNAHLAPSATKLHITLSLERLSVKLASSFTHAFDASRLEDWLSDVVRAAYVPKVNVDLNVGIPLPKILNVNFANSVLEIIEASRLEDWLSDVVRAAYVPKVNVDLNVGIPLPKILNVNFANSVLEIIEVSFLCRCGLAGSELCLWRVLLEIHEGHALPHCLVCPVPFLKCSQNGKLLGPADGVMVILLHSHVVNHSSSPRLSA
ncbi:Long palate, lung and nasal epithelium carcinoma-associated protein 3 [Tupaia chinensis]|uniref:BPI fold-containing family B member 3 n=1 Tax=Tupaia chinensis TaxID=246437 RepID=L9L793_TUPCH|nr:Long palate, lung and nasal epithelium carcinoma-associated protein 3 [Tupaia chinensis]